MNEEDPIPGKTPMTLHIAGLAEKVSHMEILIAPGPCKNVIKYAIIYTSFPLYLLTNHNLTTET